MNHRIVQDSEGKSAAFEYASYIYTKRLSKLFWLAAQKYNFSKCGGATADGLQHIGVWITQSATSIQKYNSERHLQTYNS
jgi:hypothetical protein